MGKIVKKFIEEHGDIVGDYRKKVIPFIRSCIDVGGVPMFRTKYAGERWKNDRVMIVCYGNADEVPGGFLENVPGEDVAFMESKTGEWRDILRKYGSAEDQRLVELSKTPKPGLIVWIIEKEGKVRPRGGKD